MKARITQKDLAVHLGMSQSGISMALRGDPRIGKATQARVRAAADALGYRPDPVMGAFGGVPGGEGGQALHWQTLPCSCPVKVRRIT